jgi:8-oxo-dGTP pyrophosphatase MutT (NUDIX family)
MEPWRVLESRALIERRWLTVHEQRIALASGDEIDEFHLVESPDWVAVLAFAREGDEVVLVEQYRHGVGQPSLELPAGVIDQGETPAEAAARELREETGYVAARIEPLMLVSPEPARHTTRAHFYVAWDAERVGEQRLDESEAIAVRPMPRAEVLAAIDQGRVVHAAHIGAILMAAHRGWFSR